MAVTLSKAKDGLHLLGKRVLYRITIFFGNILLKNVKHEPHKNCDENSLILVTFQKLFCFSKRTLKRTLKICVS